MGFSMTALLPEEERHGWGAEPGRWKEEHGWNEVPSFSCKHLVNAEWLPDHVKRAMYQEHTPEQAKLLADAIQKRVGQHPFDGSESARAKEALDLCVWLRYWAANGVKVRGG